MKTNLQALFVFVFIIITTTIQLSAQNDGLLKTIDSLEQSLENTLEDSVLLYTYAELYKFYRRRDLVKAKKYLDLELALCQKLGDKEQIYAAKNRLAIHHSINRELDKAKVILNELLDYYRETGNKEKQSAVLSNISTNYIERGELKMALEKQFEALRLDEEIGLKGTELGKNYFTIANILRLNEEPDGSIEWLEKARIEYHNDGAKEFEHQAIYTKGLCYLAMDSLSKAQELMEQSMDYFRSVKNIHAMSTVIRGLGNCAEAEKDYNAALKLYTESLDLSKKIGDNRREIECYLKLGEIHNARNEFKQAIPYLRKSLKLSKEKGIQIYVARLLDNLSKVLHKTGQLDEAYAIQSEYISFNDSLLIENNKVAISEIEVKYQTEKKEQEIILLEEKNKRQSLQKKAMTAGLFGLLGLLVSLFYAMRQKLKRNRIEKEKVDQELLFSQKELNLRKKELTAYALQLAHKNEILEDIKTEVKDINTSIIGNRDLQKVLNTITINQNDEDSWEIFRARFLAVHNNFETTVKEQFPNVTNNEMRLMALLKMNLNSKEIANILNISMEGVKKARYRLRKKLELQPNDSLEDLVIQI